MNEVLLDFPTWLQFFSVYAIDLHNTVRPRLSNSEKLAAFLKHKIYNASAKLTHGYFKPCKIIYVHHVHVSNLKTECDESRK
ncbi:hypothetical protein IEQ34_011330 [Dendrobium chrysotoxum]|uniref:Uncharacterized protein n=1 Tax=Dendrobium chrysotoxum TaxID=161865 RepID=A0AAV7GYL8_DENCH|nr:hypothetical protein IEQ34_011330 [Dendrobium chrysotoxum]